MKFLVRLLLLTFTSLAGAQTNEVITIKVTGDRVSLRAAPSLDGELLDRAMRGEEMVYFEQTNGWVAVQAPESLNFWVAAEFVREGLVQPQKLNVRSGPSRNYTVVAVVERDDVLAVRGEFNEWVKIAPPLGSRVWISADYVEFMVPPPAEPVEKVAEPEVVVAPTPVVAPKPVGTPVSLMHLDKTRTQGAIDEYPGILRRDSPGLYKLVLVSGRFEERICIVKGNIGQMETYLNQPVQLKGPIYWVKGIDVPVMVPDTIQPNPMVSE
ncbi:MAG: SH3 domain-containing protein [Pontiella sp.]